MPFMIDWYQIIWKATRINHLWRNKKPYPAHRELFNMQWHDERERKVGCLEGRWSLVYVLAASRLQLVGDSLEIAPEDWKSAKTGQKLAPKTAPIEFVSSDLEQLRGRCGWRFRGLAAANHLRQLDGAAGMSRGAWGLGFLHGFRAEEGTWDWSSQLGSRCCSSGGCKGHSMVGNQTRRKGDRVGEWFCAMGWVSLSNSNSQKDKFKCIYCVFWLLKLVDIQKNPFSDFIW